MSNLRTLVVIVLGCTLLLSCTQKKTITLESLLDEMVSTEAFCKYPDPYYTCNQASSHDRRTVSKDSLFWYGNNDGYNGGNFIRVDTIQGRIEKVMLDHQGPGVITRMWITSLDKKPKIRFYFDGAIEPQFIIPAYDLTQMDIPQVGDGLVFPHTSWNAEAVGGSTSYFPIPYATSCLITVELPEEVEQNPRYYQINYRSYEKGARVETFSTEQLTQLQDKIKMTNTRLINPPVPEFEQISIWERAKLFPCDTAIVHLPEGQRLINQMRFQIDLADSLDFGSVMRNLILKLSFDQTETARLPLGDFAAGGIGSYPLDSWLIENSGKGFIDVRWPMPYKKQARLQLINRSDHTPVVLINVMSLEQKWEKKNMYFHASWRQEQHVLLSNCGEEVNRPDCRSFVMADIEGKGVFRGDVLSLFNYSQSWYGEGDEHIWVDGESYPSHLGTGTEDYYNSSWAPVVVFNTPFGGAVRADSINSRGVNTWLRTRHLDGIPFQSSLLFEFELLSWFRGYADYESTLFWYEK